MDKRGTEYLRADKFSWSDIPQQYVPTQKTFYFMGVFLVISLIIGVFTNPIPIGKMMSGNTDFNIDLGFPMVLFSLSMNDASIIPFRVVGIIVDSLICLVLGLACDLAIKISAVKAKKMFSEESKYVPKLYKK